MERDDDRVMVIAGAGLPDADLIALARLHNLPEIPVAAIVVEAPPRAPPDFDKMLLVPLPDRGYRDSAPRSPKQRFRKSSKRT